MNKTYPLLSFNYDKGYVFYTSTFMVPFCEEQKRVDPTKGFTLFSLLYISHIII